MKAIVYEKGKAPDMLVLREVEKPVPGDKEVLVRIHAAAVNAADSRSMKMGAIPKRKIFGSDIAGELEAVGKSVRRFKAGDAVLGDISACGMGGFAEYVAVPEAALVLKPANVSFETAAAVPLSAVTALQGLRNLGRIKAGQKALIYGAGGGVGTFAVQLAKHLGAEVTALCGEKNVAVLRSLGADHVVSYERSDIMQGVERYDLILAVNGNRPLLAYKRLLREGGICVMVGGSLRQVIKALVFGRLLSLGSRKLRSLNAKPRAEDLQYVISLVAEGRIKPVIDRTFPLERTAEALRYQGEGHASGKIIIKIA
ncbi:MAG: NAD(P)-dependent alcohol dehydrogenase [Christensenellales bacterium]